jgi:hypothetical protein
MTHNKPPSNELITIYLVDVLYFIEGSPVFLKVEKLRVDFSCIDPPAAFITITLCIFLRYCSKYFHKKEKSY